MRTESWDVVVVGGGCAGIAAAVAAARAGSRTLLVERHGFLGGMATAALVHSLCGLYRLRAEPGAQYANPGLPSEFAERLLAAQASPGPVRMGKLDVLPHHPAAFMKVADDFVAAENNLAVRFHTEIVSVEEDAGRWRLEWICRGKRGRSDCAALVDASGDAVAASLAGLETAQAPADSLQRPAYVFGLHGIPSRYLEEEGRLQLAHRIVEGVRSGKLSRDSLGAHFRESGIAGETFCTLDLPGDAIGSYDPTDPACLSSLEVTGRNLATELTAWLRSQSTEFESCRVSQFPARAGIRESRRVLTRHLFTGEELLDSVEFPDAIALATWPMENRERATGPKWKFPAGPQPPQIPLRSLRPPGHDHFFVAGRCIGTTHEAQAAIRVMGTCLATGEAAGLGAALQAAAKPVDAEAIRTLRDTITQ